MIVRVTTRREKKKIAGEREKYGKRNTREKVKGNQSRGKAVYHQGLRLSGTGVCVCVCVISGV